MMAFLVVDIIPVFVLAWLGLCFARQWQQGQKGMRPPGPVGLPIIGNLFQMPLTQVGFFFDKIVQRYGKIAWLQMGGSGILVIGDADLAHEVLEVRSANWPTRLSDKLPYWRTHLDPKGIIWGAGSDAPTVNLARKLLNRTQRGVRDGDTQPLVEYETLIMAHQMLSYPEGWWHHIERMLISTALTFGYGISCPTGNEDVLHMAKEVMDALSREGAITASIVNFVGFGFLDAVPGIKKPWRKRAALFRESLSQLLQVLSINSEAADAIPSQIWSKTFAEAEGGWPLLLLIIIAATESSAFTLQNFVRAVVMHGGKSVIAAQRQLDAVVGQDRLPSFADRPKLPLVEAFAREVLRWRPPALSSFPLVSSVDDVVEYAGKQYFIPAGTMAFVSLQAIEHDPRRYSDPDAFKPARFLDEKGQLLPDYDQTACFSYGKRACPGRPTADKAIWIGIATMLWLFNFRKTPGHEYRDDESMYSDGLICHPLPFPVTLEPRDEHRAQVVKQAYDAHPKDPFQLF